MTVDPQVTELLRQSRQGVQSARDRVFEVLHADLKRLAAKMLHQGFRRSTVMQTTVLVNSAIERLLERGKLDAQSRRHLFALLGRAMHDVLVEEARANAAAKRGAGRAVASLQTDAPVASGAGDDPYSADELMALRAALEELATIDQSAAETVWLRAYCGRSFEQTVELMDSTLAKVRGDWEYGRAWLADRVRKETGQESV